MERRLYDADALDWRPPDGVSPLMISVSRLEHVAADEAAVRGALFIVTKLVQAQPAGSMKEADARRAQAAVLAAMHAHAAAADVQMAACGALNVLGVSQPFKGGNAPIPGIVAAVTAALCAHSAHHARRHAMGGVLCAGFAGAPQLGRAARGW
jgi:hypothetical protein